MNSMQQSPYSYDNLALQAHARFLQCSRPIILLTLLFQLAAGAPLAMGAGSCTKAAGQSWTHALYYNAAGEILQVEELQPNHDMSTRGLRFIGNNDIPCLSASPEAWSKYYCPTGVTVPMHPDAKRVVYFGITTGTTGTEIPAQAFCEERVAAFYPRNIKCGRDPTDLGASPVCRVCYCLTRPCPPVCCQ